MAMVAAKPTPRFGIRRGTKEYENGKLYDASLTGKGNGTYADVLEADIMGLGTYIDGVIVDLTDALGVYKKDETAVPPVDSNLFDSKSRVYVVTHETGEKTSIFIPNVKNAQADNLATKVGAFKYKALDGRTLKPVSVAYTVVKDIVVTP